MVELTTWNHLSPLGQVYPHMDVLYQNSQQFTLVVNSLCDFYQQEKAANRLDAIVGIEGRGFILGSVLSYLLHLPFIPARKAGKLPAKKLHTQTPWGKMEIHDGSLKPGAKVLVVDAVLDVEHSVDGALTLIEQMGAVPVGILCLAHNDSDSKSFRQLGSKEIPLQALFTQLLPTVGETLTSSAHSTHSTQLHFTFSPLSSGRKHAPLAIDHDNVLEQLKQNIRTIPHFPHQGIMFRDITSLIEKASLFQTTIELLVERYRSQKIDAILGIESRGFIFGAPLAYRLGVPFIPVSKKGKIPGETLSIEYEIEYGMDVIEIAKDALHAGDKVVVVDDLIATGGTVAAACQLIRQVGATVQEVVCLIELPALKGRQRIGEKLFTMIEFDGE